MTVPRYGTEKDTAEALRSRRLTEKRDPSTTRPDAPNCGARKKSGRFAQDDGVWSCDRHE